jgi:hypothetical protein
LWGNNRPDNTRSERADSGRLQRIQAVNTLRLICVIVSHRLPGFTDACQCSIPAELPDHSSGKVFDSFLTIPLLTISAAMQHRSTALFNLEI